MTLKRGAAPPDDARVSAAASRVVLGACLVGVLLALPSFVTQRAASAPAPAPRVTATERAAGVTFAPGATEADRATWDAAVAAARPEARALIEVVDGLVTVTVARPPGGAAGLTQGGGTRRGYDITVDLPAVAARYGARGTARVVLHELAHVVDHRLVPDALKAEMDARTPPGWGCDAGVAGGCAAREERFAESFAKWATGDVGIDVHLGYRVPPPDLTSWGDPLAVLTAAGA